MFLGLKADGHHAAQSLSESQFAEAADGFFLVESGERIVAKVAEAEQAAEAGDQADEVVVETLVLRGAAEFVGQPNGHNGSWPLRIAMVEEERSGGKAHNAEDTVQSLREHALNFAADKTRSGQVEVGECQHVALDAALFLFVECHDHEHGDKSARSGGDHAQGLALKFGSGFQIMQREAEKTVGKRLLAAALLPEDHRNADVEKRSRDNRRDREFICGVGGGPDSNEHYDQKGGNLPGLALRINLRAEKKESARNCKKPMAYRILKGAESAFWREGRGNVVNSEDEPGDGPKQ